MAATEVGVLCALPVSDIYNIQHRALYYVALAFVFLAPAHKWLTPAALSLIVLYSTFAIFYAIAMFIAPDRLGPTLDIFPVHSILITDIYAMGAVIFCRPGFLKGKRQWDRCNRMFVGLWCGHMLSNFDKTAFEKRVNSITQTAQCYAENSTSLPANIFSVGYGLACENPCASGPSKSFMHPAQTSFVPTLWGSIDPISKQFTARAKVEMSPVEISIAILFGVAFSATLWLNFFTSPQITRNTVFAIFTSSRRNSRGVRVALAKSAAVAWFVWSYIAILLAALALPFVAWVQETLLQRYPVAHTMCLVKQWAPWIIGSLFVLLKVALMRRKRSDAMKLRQSRRLRMRNAIYQIQQQFALVTLPSLPIPIEDHVDPETTFCNVNSEAATSRKTTGEASGVPFRIDIAEVRMIHGFFDGLRELKEWWSDPTGQQEQPAAASGLPSADEEKALLKGDHEQPVNISPRLPSADEEKTLLKDQYEQQT